MPNTPIRTLLVEDDTADVVILRRLLGKNSRQKFHLEQVDLLQSGLDRLGQEEFDVLLLDLNLPDSTGLETFRRVKHHSDPDLPIVVLSGLDDEELALKAVRDGAQDYLIKGELTGPLVTRAIRYAIERHDMQRMLLSLSLTDELTGLCNRRGFKTLARQQLRLAERSGKHVALLFADLDGLKEINDSLGHGVGNEALIEASQMLQRSFRAADVLARVGGDEFAVLLVDVRGDGGEIAHARLEGNVARANQRPGRSYILSMSCGLAVWSPESDLTLDSLIAAADQAMYQDKRARKKKRGDETPPR